MQGFAKRMERMPSPPAQLGKGPECGGLLALDSDEGMSLLPTPSFFPLPASGGTAFQKMEPREDHTGHNLRQDGENLKRNKWGQHADRSGVGMTLLRRG